MNLLETDFVSRLGVHISRGLFIFPHDLTLTELIWEDEADQVVGQC